MNEPCQHVWNTLAYKRTVVRLCSLCGDPDWEDLEREIDRRARAVIMGMAQRVIEETAP